MNGTAPSQMAPYDTSGTFNQISFMIQQQLGLLSTATLVKVTAVKASGGGDQPNGQLGPSGFVDVQPLVKLMNGVNETFSHGTVPGIPYFRMGCGDRAVIMDPKVGDIGLLISADRDVSSVKNTKGEATPGSRRRFDMADGMFIGLFLGGTPTMAVRFTDESIIATPDSGTTTMTVKAGEVEIKATVIKLNGAVQISGTVNGVDGTGPINISSVINSDKDINTTATVKGDEVEVGSIALSAHVHGGVSSGSSETDGPQEP